MTTPYIPSKADEQSPRAMLTTVQAGRGIAAAMVVFHHAASMFALPRYGGMIVWNGWGEIGRHGIDFFFVLSGFIIFSAHHKDIGRPDRIGTYLWRRAIRIYPVYWLYLCGFLALLLLGLGRQDVPLSAGNMVTAFSLIRFTSDMPPIQVAWTLFHELFFYGMFIVLLLSRWIGGAVMALWLAVILMVQHSSGAGSPTFTSVAFDLLNLEFFMGMAVALLWRKMRITGAWAALWAGAGLLLVSAWASHEAVIGGYLPSFCFGLASALLLMGLVSLEAAGRISAPRWMGVLGDASYTVYLLHTIILSVLLRAGAGLVQGNAVMGQGFAIAIAIMAIGISIPFYYLVERPLLNRLRHILPSKGKVKPANC